MRYVGGKARIAKWIRDHVIAIADEYRGVDLTYVEPFVGSGAVLEQIVRTRRFARHIANDIHPDLIRMWHALSREGWVPPASMTHREYLELQSLAIPTPLRGFAGFCFSFGGKWMSGFETRPAEQRRKGIGVMRRARSFRHIVWKNVNFAELVITPGSIIYCDPPYINTGHNCYDERQFNHTRFWSTMDSWVKKDSIVFVSEYTGPSHWPVIDEYNRHSVLGASNGQVGDVRTERLFMRRP